MESRSKESDVHRLEFDVEWPPGHVACYVIGGPEPILVDAAAPDHTDAFVDALSEHGYAPSDIEHVLITHPHVDHIGQVQTVLEDGDPTVYAPLGIRSRLQQDPERLRSRVRRNLLEAGFQDDRRRTLTEMVVRSLRRNAALLPTDVVDVWMEPNLTTTVGEIDVDPVHLPGHQADHLSYSTEISGDRVLLAGDMGLKPFRPIIMHDGFDDGYRDAFDAFATALDRMSELDVDRVYPGHGPIHDDLSGIVDRDRKSLQTRSDRVETLVLEDYETAPEIASALAGGRDLDYMAAEAMSALAYLEKTDRLTSEQIEGIRHYHA